jgi:hypothetical protein
MSITTKETLYISDIAITSRKLNGYINATQLCQAGNRLFNTYFRGKRTKDFLRVLSEKTHIGVGSFIKFEQKNSRDKMTWVHPQVAINIAQWISPEFDVAVSGWVYNWYTTNNQNTQEFFKKLNDIKPIEYIGIETIIRESLKKELMGVSEVLTEYGNIDLITSTQVIEIKELSKWKHAIGQILSYGSKVCQGKEKRIHLFSEIISEKDIQIIKQVTDNLDIVLTYEEIVVLDPII